MRHTLEARKWAAVAYVAGLTLGLLVGILGITGNAAKVTLFQLLYNDKASEQNRVHQELVFIDKWGQHFLHHGNLLDEHGGGMPRKVPLELALEASTLVKRGYIVYQFHDPKSNVRIRCHEYFCDIDTAVEHIPRLKQIVQECNCTTQQLYEAMIAVDPSLVRKKRHYRMLLSKHQLFERQYTGELLFNLWLSDRNLFKRTVYVDECKIHMSALAEAGVYVLCDKYDEEVDEAIETSWLRDRGDIILHFIAAVNAEEGSLYLNFTTGTTPPVDSQGVIPPGGFG